MSTNQLSMFDQDSAAAPAGAPTSFSISRTINGKQQQVCDHWLMPVFIGQWMFGPKVQAEKILNLENTVRKNGDFSYLIYRRGEEVTHSGEFLEFNPPSSLTFSWTESTHPNAECKITVQFVADAAKTKLKMNVKLPAELSANRDKIKKQWTSRCKALAEKFK